MNPWITKTVILAANVVMVVIRAPHGRGGSVSEQLSQTMQRQRIALRAATADYSIGA